MDAAEMPTVNDQGWTETVIASIRLESNSHKLRIVIMRKGERCMIGLREYRELADGQWHAHKGGISFDAKRLPVTIRSLLKGYEMTKAG